MAGDDVTAGIGPGSEDDYRKLNVDGRAGTSKTGGDIITSRLPAGADYMSVAYPTGTQEVYTFKTGGSGGTTVATLTINYTTGAKDFLSNATWA